jgi:hypothetical protein
MPPKSPEYLGAHRSYWSHATSILFREEPDEEEDDEEDDDDGKEDDGDEGYSE